VEEFGKIVAFAATTY